MGKILIATAAIGALYLIFHNTINTGIMNMYNSVKNGMLGFGDFIKKSASAIFSFFGNMFIKASEALNGGGVMTIVITSIIKEFFGNTLPKLIIHLTQDFVRTIDKTYTATEWKPDSATQKAMDKIDGNVESGTSSLYGELGKARLSFEKDILKDGRTSIEEQERKADETIDAFGKDLQEFAGVHAKESSKIKDWLYGIYEMMKSNQISSTGFYHKSEELIRSLGTLKLGDKFASLDEHVQHLITNFAQNYGHMLGMSRDAIDEYGKLTGDKQLEFVKGLLKTLKTQKERVDKALEDAEKTNTPEQKQKEGVVDILRDIRNDIQKKGATTTIIEFQETKEVGLLHETIKSFLKDTNLVDVMTRFAHSTQEKFSMILDASNKALSRLSREIASEFVFEAVDEVNQNKKSSSVVSDEPGDMIVPDNNSDYKIMYIFNNTASSNDAAVMSNMEAFFNNTANYLNTMTQEVETVTRLEALSHYIFDVMSSVCYYSVETEKSVIKHCGDISKKIDEHVNTPIRKIGGITTAHKLETDDTAPASLSLSHGGLITLGW